MDGQHHLARLRLIGESFVLIAEPQEFRLAVTLTDIHAQLDERLIYNVAECIRLRSIGRALDGDCPLVVGIGGRTPGAVLLLPHTSRHGHPCRCRNWRMPV